MREKFHRCGCVFFTKGIPEHGPCLLFSPFSIFFRFFFSSFFTFFLRVGTAPPSRLASYHPHLSTSAEPNLLNAFDLYGMHCCDVWMSVGAFVWVRERVVKGFISRGRVGEGI